MSTEVIIHSNDRIHNLLCGKQQHVGHSKNKNRNHFLNVKDNHDFSKYPFPDPIEPNKSMLVSSEKNQNTLKPIQNQMTEFSKLRDEEEMIGNVSQYLQVYETNTKRKAMLMHQELEEYYLAPLSRKLAKKTSGKDYESFVRAKSRAVSAFDKQTNTRDTFLKQLPSIPTIKIESKDLTDPILRYRKNAADEKRLTKIIQKSTGEWKEPPVFPERDTMNVKKWNMLQETRFYEGSTNNNSTKGKKVFPKENHSHINEIVDAFSPPPQRLPRIERPKRDCQIDHIKFEPY
ncbi:hypothetical protein TRFO_25122 [Tritrichomonas foetus]|uniref:Uncharacterized protein n=1 Tax=Tritrichomonas foetus TaxID=1144522 RepID=A0A1J4KBG1_9EUKA|nr:hypothetical protein TRFO_25122 [Tritrichomonas foetus]|eukprot:OHT06813.1 hypothetical protein TRFO_25122 [Tritrichomonas foetus]